MQVRILEGPMTGHRAAAPPVFLVGPARSGTSLLYKLLCLHPDAAFVSNYVARLPGVPWLAGLNRLARRMPATQRRVWFGSGAANAYVYGRPRALADRLFPMPVEGEPLFRRAGFEPPTPGTGQGTDTVEARLRRQIRTLRSATGASIFVNKRIANVYRIPILTKAFPDARFVVLVRDGRAVALSLSKVDWWPASPVPWYGGTPGDWASEGRDPWELCARNWVEELRAMEAGLAGVPAAHVLRLSYEELVAEPASRLHEVAAFAGLAPSADWDRRLDPIRLPNRNESWRDSLDPQARATIEEVQAATLAAYGYGD